jgi:hypothetical protein
MPMRRLAYSDNIIVFDCVIYEKLNRFAKYFIALLIFLIFFR